MNRAIKALVLSLAFAAQVQAKSPITIDVTPNRRLPAIPSAITVHLPANVDPDRFVFALWVQPAGKDGFFANDPYSVGPSVYIQTTPAVTSAPRELRFDIDATGTSPGWFTDSRLNAPGTYEVRIVMSKTPLKTDMQIEQARQDRSVTVSLPESITVLEPTGVDAAAWNRMIESGGGSWTAADWANGYEIAREMWTRFSDSAYGPWFALKVPVDTAIERADIAAEALRRFPMHPLADWYRYKLAQSLVRAIADFQSNHLDQKRLDQTLRVVGQAPATLLHEVIDSKTAPSNLKALAQEALDESGAPVK